MAIGKISPAGKSFTGATEYDLAQGKYVDQEQSKKPEILEQNFIFGTDYKDIGKQFRVVSDYNKNVKSPVMKFSVSFDPKEKLTDEQKIVFTKKVMNEMGIKDNNHQYMVTRHSDKSHDHHHVLANRVGLDGKTIDYSHTAYKLEVAIDKVEKEMNLNNDLAKTRRFVYDETQEKGYSIQKENFKRNKSIQKNQARTNKKSIDVKKDYLRREISNAMGNTNNLNDFKKVLQAKKIDCDLRFDKSGKLTGTSFKYDNYSVKGSALGKEFKASYVENSVSKQFDMDKGNRDRQLQQVMTSEEKQAFNIQKREDLKEKISNLHKNLPQEKNVEKHLEKELQKENINQEFERLKAIREKNLEKQKEQEQEKKRGRGR